MPGPVTLAPRLAAALLAGGLAVPAAAQQATLPPEELAGAAMEVCIRAELEAPADTGAFDATGEGDDGAVTYAHPAGPSLTLAERPDFFSCRIEVPGAGEGYYQALLAALSPAMAERFRTEDFEQVENGLVWDIVTDDGLGVTTEVRLAMDGTVQITSATEVHGPADPGALEE